MVRKLTPVEARVNEILKGVGDLPSQHVTRTFVEGQDGFAVTKNEFAKYKANAGMGVANLFSSDASKLGNRVDALFAALKKEPPQVQGLVLAKLVKETCPYES